MPYNPCLCSTLGSIRIGVCLQNLPSFIMYHDTRSKMTQKVSEVSTCNFQLSFTKRDRTEFPSAIVVRYVGTHLRNWYNNRYVLLTAAHRIETLCCGARSQVECHGCRGSLDHAMRAKSVQDLRTRIASALLESATPVEPIRTTTSQTHPKASATLHRCSKTCIAK